MKEISLESTHDAVYKFQGTPPAQLMGIHTAVGHLLFLAANFKHGSWLRTFSIRLDKQVYLTKLTGKNNLLQLLAVFNLYGWIPGRPLFCLLSLSPNTLVLTHGV